MIGGKRDERDIAHDDQEEAEYRERTKIERQHARTKTRNKESKKKPNRDRGSEKRSNYQHQAKLDGVTGVRKRRRLDKRLLDTPRADESVKDGNRTRLVVSSRASRSSERLLTDDGTSTLVVDVKVAGRVAELLLGEDDGSSVRGKDRTGQSVGRGVVDELASLLEFVVLVDEDRQDGSEDFVDHGDRLGVLGDNDGRVDKVALRLVG